MFALPLLALAVAGDLVHDETVDAETALRRSSRWVQTDTLSPYSLQQGLGTVPAWRRSESELDSCTADADTLTELVREVELAIRHVEYDAAIAALDVDLPCAQTPFERQLLGRAWMLHGYVHARQQQEADAERSFARAAVLDADLVWDETYPPIGRELFEAAATQARSDTVELSVVPVPADLMIDGVRVADAVVSLPRGPHVVQWGNESHGFQLDDADTLYLPTGAPPMLTAWASQEARHADLDALLQRALPADAQVLMLHEGTLFRREEAGWMPVRRRRGNRAIIAVGATLMLAGTATSGVFVHRGLPQRRALESNAVRSSADYPKHLAQYRATRAGWITSTVVACAGAAIFGTGVFAARSRPEPFPNAP